MELIMKIQQTLSISFPSSNGTQIIKDAQKYNGRIFQSAYSKFIGKEDKKTLGFAQPHLFDSDNSFFSIHSLHLLRTFVIQMTKNPFLEHENRIVGGDDAPFNRFNYTVALFGEAIGLNNDEEEEENRRPFCSGSLISSTWVLTSAYCDVGLPTKAVIGRNDFENIFETDYEEIDIIRRIIHPKSFTSTVSNDYDFMLLELSEESSYTPVKIDGGSIISSNFEFVTDDNENVALTAIGFGRTGLFKEQPGRLQTVEMDYVPNFLCQLNYIFPVYAAITSRMLCARRVGNGVCFGGDSGGPLILRRDDDEGEGTSDVLLGVTSFNVLSCTTLWSSVFAKVSSVPSFILEYVDDVHIYNDDE